MARKCVIHNTYTPFFVLLAGLEPVRQHFRDATELACVNRRSTEPTPGSVITVLPPHGAPLLLLAEGRGQRKGGRHRGTARRAAVDASRAPHEVEAGCLFH